MVRKCRRCPVLDTNATSAFCFNDKGGATHEFVVAGRSRARRSSHTIQSSRMEAESKGNEAAPLPRVGMFLSGIDLLRNRAYNKGSSFSLKERQLLNLEGLLPAHVSSQEEQVARAILRLDGCGSDLDRYTHLMSIQGRNRSLFYSIVCNNVERCLPLVYTPTVGLACQRFGNLYQQSRGLNLTLQHKGHISKVLRNWKDSGAVRAIVFTDGERILGLGDLGASGMGIPLGKMALYTALGGVDPACTLPVMLDVGTNNQAMLDDPMYTGLKQKRVRGAEYDEFIDEFITAAQAEFGENVLLQFEDFANANAFRLLDKYQDRCCTFNDDIQGTAAVVTAGVLAAVPLTKVPWKDHRFLFYGAGSAGLGIAELLAVACAKSVGCTVDEARGQIWCIDSRGLVFKGRKSGGISANKVAFAHEWKDAEEYGNEKQPLEKYIELLGITGIFGVSAQSGVFTEPAIKQLVVNTPKPIVFALSNPTSKSECTAENAYTWSDGACIFASGSPFQPVTLPNGVTCVPGQGNNSYIFPGVALGILVSGARRVRNEVFLTAAEALAAQVPAENLAQGCVYPSLSEIRKVSAVIAAAVAKDVHDEGLATVARPDDLLQDCLAHMWSPEYPTYA
mmetsp:Transcript_20937/g.23291  ORF Transcript_20937/g.23291 Transcript_20937/m.23291 type:complete len:621 (-) Transcript_20937:113-1975(-)|eukprot:CAMPEP_0205824572 /NCGR_PEP_ID=MMETSP0206-20130828/21605_1 /ASSEMBLY_ACC=CAM_ASM_000279 /TAXON_ID=36767 /ORGANISM="Euplotes focardii, Strain TN1" /LENGTH=620 /DNA_ID=CAMNT_0053122813 /DNA_START=21 /DNA_END=1883 /DNA_ORIENTATION=+